MSDGIDVNCWFTPPRDPETGKIESIVSKWRRQHGGIVETNKTIFAATWMPHILNVALDDDGNPYLSTDDVNTCKSLYRAFMSASNALGVTNVRNIAEPTEDERQAKNVFLAINTKLLPYQSNLCGLVVLDERNRGNIDLCIHLISSIRNALDLAQKIIEDL